MYSQLLDANYDRSFVRHSSIPPGHHAPQLVKTLSRTHNEHKPLSRVLGLKVQYFQFPRPSPPADELFDYLEANNVRVIHLMRRSRLDSFASTIVAMKTSVYIIRTASQATTRNPIVARLGDLRAFLATRDREIQLVREQAAWRPNLAYLELYFEDLAGPDHVTQIGRVMRFLSLPGRVADVEGLVQRSLAGREFTPKPISLDKCRERFVNWPAVRAAMLEDGRTVEVDACENSTPNELGAA